MSESIGPALDRDAKRLMLLVLVPVTLLFCSLGFVIQQQRHDQQMEAFYQDQIRALAESRALLQAALSRPIQHLSGTVANPFVLQAMSSDNPIDRSRALAASLSGVALRNPDYMQLRWIRPNGDEALRIDTDPSNGGIINIPDAQLQNKADRPYHRIIMALQPYDIAISEPDLNVEFGEIERPLRPTIRYSLRLPVINGIDLGYLIFNLDMNQVLGAIRRNQGDNRLYLADMDGDWILHDLTDWTWATLLNRDTRIAKTNPDLWTMLSDPRQSEDHLHSDTGLWRWSQLRIGDDAESVKVTTSLWMLANVPTATIKSASNSNLRQSLALDASLFIALLVFTLVLYLTQRRATQLRRENQQITQELDTNLTFQQTLNNVLPALVLYWDQNERCQYVNETFERWFKVPGSDLIGRHFEEVFSDEDFHIYYPLLERGLRGETVTFERSVENQNGTQHLHTTYVPHRQNDPANPRRTVVIGVISISTDLTEVIQARKDVEDLNQALAERTRQAETTAAAKSHFLANMSHEIRTPMNAIIGLLDIIRDTQLSLQQLDYIDNARSSAKSLLHVLNDILDLSKLEAGKLTINQESFDVERLFNSTVKLFDSAFYKKGVELLVWVDPRIPSRLKGDPHRLNQVLNNLVGNALKFTRQGEVIMAVTLVSKNDYSAHLMYSVKDTGIGIPADKQQSIFEYFNQADNDTTREFGGTGLGLSICRTLVQLMDGSIGVRSNDAAGSEFYFELNHQIVEDITLASPSLQRVLVVDSSNASLKMSEAYLHSWNIQVDSAQTVAQGLAAFEAEDVQYDAVLIDWELDDGPGVELLTHIQSSSKAAPLTVMLTHQDPYDLLAELKAQNIPEVPLLKKPFTSSSLYDVLCRLNQNAGNSEPNDTVGQQKQMREQANRLSEKRILMVEDNALNQEIASTLLANLGIPLEVCDSGEAALQLLRLHRYDAVLMDLHMPEMDGFETTRRIREIWGSELPIIALSAAVMEDDIAQARGAGMDDHVAKPIDLSQLVGALHRWIPDIDVNTGAPKPKPVAPGVSADLQGIFVQMGENTDEVMNRFQNQEATVRHLLLGFSRNYHDFNDKLSVAAEADDNSELKRMLHTLKGTSGSLGLNRLSDAAREVETQIKEGRPMQLNFVQQQLAVVLTALDGLDSKDLPKTPVALEDTPALLANVDEVLSRSRVLSADLIMRLRSLAVESPQAELYQQLIDCIDRFEYTAARNIIEQLRGTAHV